MMTSYLLALDQSISCSGYCLFHRETGNLVTYGCIKTKKDDGDLYTRCDTLRLKLIQMLVTNNIDTQDVEYVREGLGFGASNSNASRDLAYLVGFLERTFITPMRAIAPTSLKKFATGSGKAKKPDMIAALPEPVRELFFNAGYKKSTGLADLADAYFIGQYFMKEVADF